MEAGFELEAVSGIVVVGGGAVVVWVGFSDRICSGWDGIAVAMGAASCYIVRRVLSVVVEMIAIQGQESAMPKIYTARARAGRAVVLFVGTSVAPRALASTCRADEAQALGCCSPWAVHRPG